MCCFQEPPSHSAPSTAHARDRLALYKKGNGGLLCSLSRNVTGSACSQPGPGRDSHQARLVSVTSLGVLLAHHSFDICREKSCDRKLSG